MSTQKTTKKTERTLDPQKARILYLEQELWLHHNRLNAETRELQEITAKLLLEVSDTKYPHSLQQIVLDLNFHMDQLKRRVADIMRSEEDNLKTTKQ
jgi:hypothetical protein